MSQLHFADNTVLIHFGLIGRLDLLEQLLNGRGTWTSSVQIECLESSKYDGLDELVEVERFLGDAEEPSTEAEYLAIAEIREELRIPGDSPHKHLGEAETLAIIHTRSLDAHLVTDDTGAIRVARRLEIPVVTTAQLLLLAARVNIITTQGCWDYLSTLQITHSRYLPDAPASYADVLIRCGHAF